MYVYGAVGGIVIADGCVPCVGSCAVVDVECALAVDADPEIMVIPV